MPRTENKKQPGEPITDPMVPEAYRIERVRRDTADTFTLELGPANGSPSFEFIPGQFNMLYVYGVGEIPISISGDPTHPDTLVHTTRVVGTVTRALQRLKAGAIVGVRGPFGSHWPVEEARGNDVVLVAGGIGLAPLRPALHYLLAHRRQYGKIVVLYGTRTPSDIIYRPQLEQWRSRFDLETHVTVDRADERWLGNVGVVTKLIPHAPFGSLNTVAMICGPEVMMRYTAMALQKRGVPVEHIFVSLERNMKCGIGLCGHCQFSHSFVCKDGPVYGYDRVMDLLNKREI